MYKNNVNLMCVHGTMCKIILYKCSVQHFYNKITLTFNYVVFKPQLL